MDWTPDTVLESERKHKSSILMEQFLRSSPMILAGGNNTYSFKSRWIEDKMQRLSYYLSISDSLLLLSVVFFLLQYSHTQAYTIQTVLRSHTDTHVNTHTHSASVSEVKLFHLSGVLLSSYKASVRTAGRLIVTY